jgi:hypothetical protein
MNIILFSNVHCYSATFDHLCGLVVSVPGYRTEMYCFL